MNISDKEVKLTVCELEAIRRLNEYVCKAGEHGHSIFFVWDGDLGYKPNGNIDYRAIHCTKCGLEIAINYGTIEWTAQ